MIQEKLFSQPTLNPSWLALTLEQTLQKPGTFTKIKAKDYTDAGLYPVVDQGAIFISGYINDKNCLYKGELPLIIFGDHTRNIKYINFPFAVGADGTKILKPIRLFNNLFYYYYLKRVEIADLGYRRHYSILKQVKIPLPPLAEQERIVAKLDTLFAQLDAMRKSMHKIPTLLKDFRQQVLTQAVTGKLTEEWRDGKELEEWAIENIQNLSTKVGSGSTPHGGQIAYQTQGIPLIRSMNVHFDGIKYEGLAYLNEEQAYSLRNVEVQVGDVLLNITGASIGRVCLAPRDLNGARVNQHVSIIRVKHDLIDSLFLSMYLASSRAQMYIANENYGVTRQALTKGQVLEFKISLPPLLEQQEIVRQVESLFAKADAIETQYKTLKTKIEQLPQAILHKAFKGELVAQLASDGDARDLLKKIMELKK